MQKNIFISTSIPYVNADPHLGHALEFVEADIFARHLRRENSVFFTSGTDDNALKNVLKAEESGEAVRSYVKRHAETFKTLCADLDISVDHFTETSDDEDHARGATALWEAAAQNGDIYTKEYEGTYCIGCEEFKTDKELSEHGECPEHPGKALESIREKNYFFKLSKYGEVLRTKIENAEIQITPPTKKNEILSFIEGGLEDFSISRSVERARGWGIPVPGDSSQVMYVWFDALANYVTAAGYPEKSNKFEELWTNAERRIHLIGKGINRFHSVYWPAMLISAGLSVPTDIVVHGYFTVDGQKMSKSLGNSIDPQTLITSYGKDAVRYYFARHVHPFEDSDFTLEKFNEAYTAHLTNGLGNVVSRVMKMAEDNLEPKTTEHKNTVSELRDKVSAHLSEFRVDEAMNAIFSAIQEVDHYIQETLPFKKVRSLDPEEVMDGKRVIEELVSRLAAISGELEIFMPETALAILAAIKENKKPDNLFARIE